MTLLEHARLHYKRHGTLPTDLYAALAAEGYTDIERLVQSTTETETTN